MNKRLRISFGLILCGTLLASIAFAQVPRRIGHANNRKAKSLHQALPPILKKLLANSNRISYFGERQVTVLVNGRTTQHVEIVTKQGRNTRIDFPSNSPFAGQVLLTIGERRLHYFPKRNTVRVMPGFKDEAMQGLLNNPKSLEPIQIQITNGGDVAGLATRKVSLFDKQHRLRQELWIDPSSGALLARDGYSANGKPLASFYFYKISFNPEIRPNTFSLPAGTKQVTPLDTLKKVAKQLRLVPFALQERPGIQLLNARKMVLNGEELMMAAYSGGRGRISFFELGKVVNGPIQQNAQKGVNTVKRVVGQETLFLVGKYSVGELRQLLDSAVRV